MVKINILRCEFGKILAHLLFFGYLINFFAQKQSRQNCLLCSENHELESDLSLFSDSCVQYVVGIVFSMR